MILPFRLLLHAEEGVNLTNIKLKDRKNDCITSVTIRWICEECGYVAAELKVPLAVTSY